MSSRRGLAYIPSKGGRIDLGYGIQREKSPRFIAGAIDKQAMNGFPGSGCAARLEPRQTPLAATASGVVYST
jgi:hypothetical protein